MVHERLSKRTAADPARKVINKNEWMNTSLSSFHQLERRTVHLKKHEAKHFQVCYTFNRPDSSNSPPPEGSTPVVLEPVATIPASSSSVQGLTLTQLWWCDPLCPIAHINIHKSSVIMYYVLGPLHSKPAEDNRRLHLEVFWELLRQHVIMMSKYHFLLHVSC